MKIARSAFVAVIVVWLAMASAETALNPEQQAHYYDLLNELRCLVCQNESLYESRAELAEDLRREVRKMLVEGRSDEAILDFMTKRYGDFVLYRPRMRPATYALWFGPWLLLLVGVIVVIRLGRRRADRSASLSEEERRRLNRWVHDPEQPGS
jgi:cytochrome c-type biogenesis protein CcmH